MAFRGALAFRKRKTTTNYERERQSLEARTVPDAAILSMDKLQQWVVSVGQIELSINQARETPQYQRTIKQETVEPKQDRCGDHGDDTSYAQAHGSTRRASRKKSLLPIQECGKSRGEKVDVGRSLGYTGQAGKKNSAHLVQTDRNANGIAILLDPVRGIRRKTIKTQHGDLAQSGCDGQKSTMRHGRARVKTEEGGSGGRDARKKLRPKTSPRSSAAY